MSPLLLLLLSSSGTGTQGGGARGMAVIVTVASVLVDAGVWKRGTYQMTRVGGEDDSHPIEWARRVGGHDALKYLSADRENKEERSTTLAMRKLRRGLEEPQQEGQVVRDTL